MRWGKEADSEPVQAYKQRCALLTELGAPLALLARGAQPPPIQLMYYGAAPVHSGKAYHSIARTVHAPLSPSYPTAIFLIASTPLL